MNDVQVMELLYYLTYLSFNGGRYCHDSAIKADLVAFRFKIGKGKYRTLGLSVGLVLSDRVFSDMLSKCYLEDFMFRGQHIDRVAISDKGKAFLNKRDTLHIKRDIMHDLACEIGHIILQDNNNHTLKIVNV